MRRWRIDLHNGSSFELECATPPTVTEITPPAPVAAEGSRRTEGKPVLTVPEAAELLGVCKDTVYTLVHRADFPTVRIGRSIRIDRRGLEDWVSRQAEGALA